jgi:hypothetical protein
MTLVGSFALVGLIAFADYHTGYDIRLAILYLVPIAWSTWRLGGATGAVVALSATVCWIFTFESSHFYVDQRYFYLEGAITGATFLIIVALLARLHRALERSDERFVTVLEGLDAAVQVQDARSGATLYHNGRFRKVFGEARPFTQDGGEVYDGATKAWYQLRSWPLRWTDGRDAVLRVLSDITDERRGRELIAKHREAAHRTSRLVALGEFASAVAHELNQPLAAIATYNDACMLLLQQKGSDAAELREAMQKCRDQAKRAGAIIQRLRELLRHPVPERSLQDLNEVAQTALQLAESQALEAGVVLELELAPGLPQVRTDRLLVEQVALNLVRNAIEEVQKLAPERRRVLISTAAEPQGTVTLSVTDYGDGVRPEVIGRLFEAFVTTKPRGLGLGLSICRSVIESLGGSIGYQADGRRSRFGFALPVEAI